MKLSLFTTFKAEKPHAELELEAIYTAITTGTLTATDDLICPANIATNEAERKNWKKNLPAVTFGYRFSPNATERKLYAPELKVRLVTTLVVLDFDKLGTEQLQELQQRLLRDEKTVLLFVSPSGRGLKLVVRVAGLREANYKAIYSALLTHYATIYQGIGDKQTNDLARLCFLCHDANAYYNPDALANINCYQAEQLLLEYPQPVRTSTYEPVIASAAVITEDTEKLDSILTQCEASQINLTAGYDNWFKVGCSLFNTLGEDLGRIYFHKFSRFDANYDTDESDTLFNGIVESEREEAGKITLATLIKLAKDAGLSIPRNRKATIENITTKTPTRLKIIDYITSNYVIYFDNGTNNLYLAERGESNPETFKLLTERSSNLNELLIELDKAGISASKVALWEAVFNPTIYKDINILHQTFETLETEYDGRDYINDLLAAVDVGKADQELFAKQFRKWLVACVAQAYGVTKDKYHFRNEYLPVLTGAQGTGKSGFFQNLLWDDKYYYDGSNFEFNNKNHLVNLSTKILICLEEMNAHSKADIALLKAVLSQHKISLDRKFQDERDYSRTGSFCGCTNHTDFLKDSTGDRRFLVFELQNKIDFDLFNSINKRQLWGQLVTEFKAGASYQFDQEEIKSILARNQQSFTMESQEDYFISSELEITGNESDFITYAELNTTINSYISTERGLSNRINQREIKNKLKLVGGLLNKQRKIKGQNVKGIGGVRLKSQALESTAFLDSSEFISKYSNN